MKNQQLLVVDWSMGAMLIGVFAIVVIAMVLIIYNMVSSKSQKSNNDDV